jgi:hypothetical protein
MATVYKPYIGSGKIYARVAGADAPMIEVGNVSKLELGVEEETKEMQDYTKPGGGVYASVSRIKNITVGMSLHDLNPTNLARAIFGTASAVTGGTVTAAEYTAYKGGLIRLAHPNPTAVAVKNDGATVTYTLGTDYEVRKEGIFILDTFTGAEESGIEVTYTYAGYDVVEALTSSSVTLEMAFGGLNEADSGKPVLVDLYRVKIGAAKTVSLIGDDFAALEVEGKLQADTTKTGEGISQYYKVSMA